MVEIAKKLFLLAPAAGVSIHMIEKGGNAHVVGLAPWIAAIMIAAYLAIVLAEVLRGKKAE